jgi:hypothetical protein
MLCPCLLAQAHLLKLLRRRRQQQLQPQLLPQLLPVP